MTDEVPEAILNLLEMVVRCYDCCLSCAAHLVIVDEEGRELARKEITIGA